MIYSRLSSSFMSSTQSPKQAVINAHKAHRVTPTELRYSISLSSTMDKHSGGSNSQDQSHRHSRHTRHPRYQEEEDYRQRQQHRGIRRGYPCQFCGLEFNNHNEMMLHTRTDCMARFGYYPGGMMPPQREDHFLLEHEYGASASASRSAPQHYGHPRSSSRTSAYPTHYTHGAESSVHYNIGRGASAVHAESADAPTVTPMRRHGSGDQDQDLRIRGSGESQSSRSVSFSPSTAQAKLSSRDLHQPSSAEETTTLLKEPLPLVRLLSSGELDELSEQDRTLCQSIVLFCSKTESPDRSIKVEDQTASVQARRSPVTPFHSPPRSGHASSSSPTAQSEQVSGNTCQFVVGFQCAYCMSSPFAAPPGGTPFARVFPGSIETIAASLNLVKERHFQSPPRTGSLAQTPSPSGGQGGCLCLPENVRMIFQAGRAQAAHKLPEQRYSETMTLQSLCQKVAQRVGIENKFPHKTGIVLRADIQDYTYKDTSSSIEAPQWAHPPGPPRRSPVSLSRGSATMHEGAARGDTFGYGAALADTPSYDAHHPPILSHRSAPPATTHEATFVQDSYGWSCPYCTTLPYNYRAPGSFYRERPSPEYMNRHFDLCTGLHGDRGAYEQGSRMPAYDTHYQRSPEYGYPPGPWSSSMPPPDPYRHPSHYASSYERPEYPHGGWYEPGQASYPAYGGHGHTPAASQNREATEVSISQAIDLLTSLEEEDPDEEALVLPDDKLLLTDYFFHLNKQLRVCRFTEKDRKTRGGKREKIELGFGGLQCRHCAETSGSRKFFWSDVDRLANSFAEIPGHILKCRKCPDDVKQALNELKLKHPEQMARLPRGSQKVFFRRMWRRLHQQDSSNLEAKSPSTLKEDPESEKVPESGEGDGAKRSATHDVEEPEEHKKKRFEQTPHQRS